MPNFSELVAFFERDAEDNAQQWRREMMSLLESTVAELNKKGVKAILLNPMVDGEKLPVEGSETLIFYRLCLPVMLTTDIFQSFDIAKEVFSKRDVFGLSRYALTGIRGSMLSYMLTRMCQLLQIRGDEHLDMLPPIAMVHGGEVLRMSQKYYLPLLYRAMEENEGLSGTVFEMERKWSKLVGAGSYQFLIGRPLPQNEEAMKKKVLELAHSKSFPLTGTSVAFQKDIPLPIEFAPTDIGLFKTSIEKLLGKVETRMVSVNHPSGAWYIQAFQVIVGERLFAMAYNTLSFSTGGIARNTRGFWTTSPFITMEHLCYDAWLMERRGIERSKGVYALFREYRDKVMERTDQSYETVGLKDDWVAGYKAT